MQTQKRTAEGVGYSLEFIDDRRRLFEVRQDWDEIYALDTSATVFQSWSWVNALVDLNRERWQILALRGGARYVAFLPLAWIAFPTARIKIGTELAFLGSGINDYMGMLVDPAHEEEAIERFASAIDELAWDVFYLKDVLDERILRMSARLDSSSPVRSLGFTTPCPYLQLSRNFDSIVAEMSLKPRQQLRRSMRQLEALPEVRIGAVDPESFGDMLDVVLEARIQRFGGSLVTAQRTWGRLYRQCYEAGFLRMYTACSQGQLIACAIGLVDPAKRAFAFCMIYHNEAYGKLSPGKAMVGWAIREAIAEGCDIFDFMRGDEPYKAWFTKTQRRTLHYAAVRKTLRAESLFLARPLYQRAKIRAAKFLRRVKW